MGRDGPVSPGRNVEALRALTEKIGPKRVKGELVGVRLQPDQIKALDAYRGLQTRQEAIRRILEEKLR